MTAVLDVPHRRNAGTAAKQLASIERISGGRRTAGFEHSLVAVNPAGRFSQRWRVR
jgi:hypothetical protein